MRNAPSASTTTAALPICTHGGSKVTASIVHPKVIQSRRNDSVRRYSSVQREVLYTTRRSRWADYNATITTYSSQNSDRRAREASLCRARLYMCVGALLWRRVYTYVCASYGGAGEIYRAKRDMIVKSYVT